MKRDFIKGLRHGAPIGIGYFAVSFSFGILSVKQCLTPFAATLISMTNLTSAGQFAGLTVIAAAERIFSMILIQLVINLRYALMGFSLNQHLAENISLPQRAIIAFSNTDEIFAVAMSQPNELTFLYMLGLAVLPWIGWSSGTLIGAVCGEVLPKSITTALGIALYGMLISIVMPHAREKKSVRVVAFIALLLSCAFTYIPLLKYISSGIAIVICTVLASLAGAYFFPVEEDEK